jgi:hypothetical protein
MSRERTDGRGTEKRRRKRWTRKREGLDITV